MASIIKCFNLVLGYKGNKYKGAKLLILINAVVYIGLFLTKKPLKWFKLYFMEF